MASFQEFLAELKDDGHPVKAARLSRLSQLDEEERVLFLEAWSTFSAKRRRQVIRLLVDLAEDNVELNFDDIFLSSLSDSDARVRADAIRGLWEYDNRDLIEPLINLLSVDGDTDVRAEAALALGRFVLQWEFGALRDRYFHRVEESCAKPSPTAKRRWRFERALSRPSAPVAFPGCGRPSVRRTLMMTVACG